MSKQEHKATVDEWKEASRKAVGDADSEVVK